MFGTGTILVVLLSCGEGPPTGLSDLDDDRVDSGGSPAPMFSLDCGGGGCDGGSVSETLILQITYPLGGTTPVGLPDATEPRVFKFTFEGQYEAWFPPPEPPDTGSPRFYTNADARGFLLNFRCHAALSTWYPLTGSFGPGTCWDPPPGTLPNITKIQRVSGGIGTLSGSGSGMLLIGPPYRVSVHRLEVPIALRRLSPPSSPPAGQVGVLAEVRPTPKWVGGFLMPMRVVGWTWTPTQAGVSPETVIEPGSCPIGFTDFWIFCSFTARESGVLTVRASVNGGTEQEASITVNVLDCITGDSLLDNDPLLRRGLRDLWDASQPSANRNDRLEQLGSVVCGPEGCLVTPIVPTDVGPCHVNGTIPVGTDIISHVHPFIPLPGGGDPLPRSKDICPPRRQTLFPGEPDTFAAAGPSRVPGGDVDRVASTEKPMITVDGGGVYYSPFLPRPQGASDDEWRKLLAGGTKRIVDRTACDPLAF